MAEASLRYVIVHGEARFSRTECICGQNSRSEYRNGPFLVGGDPKRPETMQLEFGPRRALIHNRDLGYRFDIDLESRVHTAFELHEYRRPGVTSFTPKVESHEPSGRTDTPVFTDVGPRESGFPLLVRRTHHSNFKDAAGNIRIHTSEDCDEVIEFSEAPLPADLFVPPRE